MTTPNNIIWHPHDHEWTKDCHLSKFMEQHGFKSFESLHKKSVSDLNWFWTSALDDMGLEWFCPFSKVFDDSEGFPTTRWFLDGKINITHNCLDRHIRDGHGNDVALIYEPDSGCHDSNQITYNQLKSLVDRCAASLNQTSLKKGDAVGLYAPMSVETVAVMFACFQLGLRFAPIFCGFGEHAVVDRLESCEAKILFANENLQRRGKSINTGATALEASKKLPLLEHIIHLDTDQWEQFLNKGTGTAPTIETEAEDPCMIIYTSGTTGKPKGTVHTHAGVLAQVGKELRYSFDIKPNEPFFWVTDIGWMMGPWELIGCLLFRTPVVLLDGAPNHPHPDRLWEIIEKNRVVTLGISPTAIRLFMNQTEGKGVDGYDFSHLRIMGSTGEAWDEASYRWAFEKIGKKRVPIMNISGGTEIMGCHLQPYPVLPLKPMTLGKGALGMDVHVFNDEGNPIHEEVGHLVCCRPAPSMTKSFLNDHDRYLTTYFEKFGDQVWYHGDWASIDQDGFWFLHGRTDDTVKVAGKRVGPAEVESALILHQQVSQAAVIGIPDDLKGQTIVCFVVAEEEVTEEELQNFVAEKMGKPLKPKAVFKIVELPKTRSGKIVRGTIQRAFLGEPLGDLSSVENPNTLSTIAEFSKS